MDKKKKKGLFLRNNNIYIVNLVVITADVVEHLERGVI